MKLAEDVDLWRIAEMTAGASGADIKAICTEAGYNALRSKRKIVRMEDFIKAVRKVLGMPGARARGAYNSVGMSI